MFKDGLRIIIFGYGMFLFLGSVFAAKMIVEPVENLLVV